MKSDSAFNFPKISSFIPSLFSPEKILKLRPLKNAINSLNSHSRANGNPVPDQVEDKHFQVVMDSHFRGNDRKWTFFKGL